MRPSPSIESQIPKAINCSSPNHLHLASNPNCSSLFFLEEQFTGPENNLLEFWNLFMNLMRQHVIKLPNQLRQQLIFFPRSNSTLPSTSPELRAKRQQLLGLEKRIYFLTSNILSALPAISHELRPAENWQLRTENFESNPPISNVSSRNGIIVFRAPTSGLSQTVRPAHR